MQILTKKAKAKPIIDIMPQKELIDLIISNNNWQIISMLYDQNNINTIFYNEKINMGLRLKFLINYQLFKNLENLNLFGKTITIKQYLKENINNSLNIEISNVDYETIKPCIKENKKIKKLIK